MLLSRRTANAYGADLLSWFCVSRGSLILTMHPRANSVFSPLFEWPLSISNRRRLNLDRALQTSHRCSNRNLNCKSFLLLKYLYETRATMLENSIMGRGRMFDTICQLMYLSTKLVLFGCASFEDKYYRSSRSMWYE